MKRRQVIFVSIVYGIVVTGFILERQRERNPFESFSSTASGPIDLPPVELPAGEEVLQGTVVDENNQALGDVGIHLYRGERSEPDTGPKGHAEPLLWTRSDAAGHFQIVGAPAGDFRVALLSIGRPTTETQISLPAGGPVHWMLNATADPPNVLAELELAPLSGRVAPPVGTLPTPHPIDGYEVWFKPVGEEEVWLTGRVPRRVTVDANGHFELQELVAGRYLVRVLPRWATGGTWPILEEIAYVHPGPSQLSQGALPALLSLRLRSGTIGGHAYDDEGSPLEGAMVKVWPKGQPELLWPTLATDAQGAFLIRDLPPGPYSVRLSAGSAEFEGELNVRIGARTSLTPPPLAPRSDHE